VPPRAVASSVKGGVVNSFGAGGSLRREISVYGV
jgi:hypothetical protein